jgi:hypothetical protein
MEREEEDAIDDEQISGTQQKLSLRKAKRTGDETPFCRFFFRHKRNGKIASGGGV